MTTLTGRILYPTNFEVPSMVDVAVQLGRLPRYAGATAVWPWSVLHHTWVCMQLARLERYGFSEREILMVALHDAEEVATGDVPTTWKPAELREMQRRLRHRIWAEVCGCSPTAIESWEADVSEVDKLALLAEMHAGIAPPDALAHSGLQHCYVNPAQLDEAVAITRQVHQMYDDPKDCQYGTGLLVLHFLEAVQKLAPREHTRPFQERAPIGYAQPF